MATHVDNMTLAECDGRESSTFVESESYDVVAFVLGERCGCTVVTRMSPVQV